MTPGYAYMGACYATLAEAQQTQCETAYPISGADQAGQPYTLSCSGVSVSGLTLVRADSLGVAPPVTFATTYAECNVDAVQGHVITPQSAFDAFAWGFSGVVVVYLFAHGIGSVLSMLDSPSKG